MQTGWNWKVVKDTAKWKQPDGAVMALVPLLSAWQRPRVYDIGCGLGRHLTFFSSIGCDVAGSDISPEAVAESSRVLRALNVVPDVKEGRMTRIDQPDGAFSLVIALRVIHHATKSDVVKAITEVHRILVPGGYFFATFKADTEARPKSAIILDAQTAIWQDEPEKGIPHFYSRRDDVLDFMGKFTTVSLKYCDAYEAPGFVAGKINAWYEMLAKKS
jgi:SAM-dependent methyltransferase